jgi:hypothetical protein
LPKSRSIEIASGKNKLALVADAPAVAKPKFRDWDHGRPIGSTPPQAFSSKRIDLR